MTGSLIGDGDSHLPGKAGPAPEWIALAPVVPAQGRVGVFAELACHGVSNECDVKVRLTFLACPATNNSLRRASRRVFGDVGRMPVNRT